MMSAAAKGSGANGAPITSNAIMEPVESSLAALSLSDAKTRDVSREKIGANTNLNEMKDAVHELFHSEVIFLKSLSIEDKAKIFPQWWAHPDASAGKWEAPINHLGMTGEIALVLARIKPCSVTCNHFLYPEYGKKLYDEVVLPWYQKFFTEGSGFVCELSAPGVAYYPTKNAEGKTADFGNNTVFRDTKHPDSSLVAEVFTRIHCPVDNEELRVCFGIPASYRGRNVSPIQYQFQNPKAIYKMEQLCCSPCLEYEAREADAAAVGRHFRKCRKAMKTLGHPIALDIYHQEDSTSNNAWSAGAIANTFFEAAGRDLEEFKSMIRDDELWVRCDRKKLAIIQTVFEYAPA